MAQFSYEEYAAAVARAQEGGDTSSSKKIGWLKLADQGEALVRFNISSVNDLSFNAIHQLGANSNWMKVSCLNSVGRSVDCPLCQAVAAGNTAIGKSLKKVYLQALVSYRDAATGTWSEPIPVIWERPASFSRDVASMLRDYGDLRKVLLKISRTGGGLDTRYSVTYAVPSIFSPDLIPEDFSAFDNFNIAKHSYWDKSKTDIEAFLATGQFPEATATQVAAPIQTPTTQPVVNAATATPATAWGQPAYQAATQPSINAVEEDDLPFTMGSEAPSTPATGAAAPRKFSW